MRHRDESLTCQDDDPGWERDSVAIAEDAPDHELDERLREAMHEDKRTVLVTGAAGYVGSVLTPLLLERGFRVIAYDNFMHRQVSLMDCCWNRDLEIVRGDVRDVEKLLSCVDRSDIIVPLAAHVGAHACDVDPQVSDQVNVKQVRDIVKAKGNKPLIFPHTNTGYGTMEEGTTHCTEETPMRPVSLYGKQKVVAEKMLDGDSVSLRLATVFGASPRPRIDLLVNHVVYRAVSDGFFTLYEPDAKRNYLHVRDCARAFLHAISRFKTMRGQAYNVGLSNANLSKLDLCEHVRKHVPDFRWFVGEGEDRDRRNYVVSNARAEATGWSCLWSLDDGIGELIKSFQVISPWAAWGNNG